MAKLLVNTPTGKQQIIEVMETGSYFDTALVIWDERIDGELPVIELGKMQRDQNGQLITLLDYLPEHAAAVRAESIPSEVHAPAAIEALINAGVYDAVDTYINTLTTVDKVYWQRSAVFHRNNQLIEKVRVQMAWTQDYIDDLFIAADVIQKSWNQ